MARVSLIILRAPGIAWPSGRVAAYRAGLEDRGYPVEVLVVADPTIRPTPGPEEPWSETLVAGGPGLSEAAIAGLRSARGALLVVLDLGMPYAPEDVFAVVDRLASGDAELVVARRPGRWESWPARRLLATADPTSGLIGLTRTGAELADDSFAPVGDRFALELLARVGGRRADVPVGPVAPSRRARSWMGDIRQFKRLADDRFGNASRLLQFCVVGASGMVVDLTCYAILQAILAHTGLASMTAPVVGGSLGLAVAAVLAIATALTWNFSLNRRLTFNDARRGSMARQFVRYVLSNLLGVGLSLTLRLVLPNTLGFFRRHRLAAAVVGIVSATGISFTMARWFVFGHRPAEGVAPAPIPRRRCDGLRLHARADRISSRPLEEPIAARGPIAD